MCTVGFGKSNAKKSLETTTMSIKRRPHACPIKPDSSYDYDRFFPSTPHLLLVNTSNTLAGTVQTKLSLPKSCAGRRFFSLHPVQDLQRPRLPIRSP